MRRIDEPETSPKPAERQQTSEPLYRRFLHGVKEAAASPFSYIKEHSWSTVPDAVVAAGKAIGHGTANAFAYTKEHPWQVAGAVTLPLLLVPTLAACGSPDPTPSPTPPKPAFTQTPKPPPEISLPSEARVENMPLAFMNIDDVRSELRKAGNMQGSHVLADYPSGAKALFFDFIGNDELEDVMVIVSSIKPRKWGHDVIAENTRHAFDTFENNGLSLVRRNGSIVNSERDTALTGLNIYKTDGRLILLARGDNALDMDVQGSNDGFPFMGPQFLLYDFNTQGWSSRKILGGTWHYIGNFDTDAQIELGVLDSTRPFRVFELDNLMENTAAGKEIALAIKDYARASQKGDTEDLRLLWQEHGPVASMMALALFQGYNPESYRSLLEEGMREGKKLEQVVSDNMKLVRAERSLLVAMQSGSKDELRSAVEGMRANDPAPALAAMFRIYGDDFQRYVSERVAGLDVALLAGEMVRGRFDSAFANAAIGNYGGALFDLATAYGIERGAAASVRYISDHQNLSPLRERNVDTTYALSGLQIDRDLLTADEQNALTSGGAVNNVISVKRMDEIKAAQEARNKQESLWSSLFGN